MRSWRWLGTLSLETRWLWKMGSREKLLVIGWVIALCLEVWGFERFDYD